ncbi:MAG: TldD/PmbA family protein [bacterium]|nr:TldD/PmbA family protein [bacterium]
MRDMAYLALNTALEYGATFCEVRVIKSRRQGINVKNELVEELIDRVEEGIGIRVIANGSWGFAGTSILDKNNIIETAKKAVDIARASSLTKRRNVELSPAKRIIANWKNLVKINPFEVPLDKKVSLLIEATKIMTKVKDVKIAEGSMDFWETEKFFVNSEGTEIFQHIIESGSGICAYGIREGDVQRRSYPNSFGGQYETRGYELIEEINLLDNAQRIAEEASALLDASECPSTVTTLILDGSQVALQVHESIGHPIELDRILGMEASYAGTSFISVNDRGRLKYGSKIMNITADATLPNGLGSFGYDDEGIPAQRVDIVREGILLNFLTNRETACILGETSNGTCRADGWKNIPLIRMTNINLEPGTGTLEDLIKDTDEGIFMCTNKSWSIDDKRLNFQFGLEIAWEIKDGKLTRILKNPNYTGITPEFWSSLDAVCGSSEWKIWGVPNCGKGQPGQLAHVGHGTSPARFRNVRVGVK